MAISLTYVDDNDGTGGILTVSGTTAGVSVNTVYVSEYTGGENNRAFRVLGTRVGDGTVLYVVSQSGPFMVHGVSNTAGVVEFSAPKVFRAADGVDSLHYRVAAAFREMVLAMALPGVTADPDSHLVCKIGARIQDLMDEDKKCVFYIPTQESISYMDNTFDQMEFPVNVVVAKESGQDLVKGLQDTLKARQLTHWMFGAVPIPDLPEVHTVDYRPGVINDASQWAQKYEVMVMTLVALSEQSGGIY